MLKLFSFTLHALALFGIVGTLLPLLSHGTWYIRIFDFPRAQLFGGMFLILTTTVALAAISEYQLSTALSLALIACLGYQSIKMLPYTPLFSSEVPPYKPATQGVKPKSWRVKILIANLKFDNPEHQPFIDVATQLQPDLILLSEVTQEWYDSLETLRNDYPHEIKEIRNGNGHGILFLSKIPVDDSRLNYLVTKERPSTFATIQLDEFNAVDVWGLHPAPPGLEKASGERRSSRPRDAELLLVAEQIANSSNPTLVIGDFNDTAWSETTTLFKTVSNMKDPRVGRGFYNTFHAEYPLLRYPIDHVFVSEHFSLAEIGRTPAVGSDHFPMYATVYLTSTAEDNHSLQDLEQEELEKKNELIKEGLERAK